MSGQHEQWDKLDRVDQLDPLDATMDLSRLIERVKSQLQAEEHGHGNGRTAGNGMDDPGNGSSGHTGAFRADQASQPPHRAAQASQPFQVQRPEGAEPKAPAAKHAAVAKHVAVRDEPAQVSVEAGDVVRDSHLDRPGEVGHLDAALASGAKPAIGVADAVPADGAAVRGAATVPADDLAVTAEAVAVPGDAAALPDRPATVPADDLAVPTDDLAVPADDPLLGPQAPVKRLDPGSRADLRQRLERLPFGHPSSPYHVDGELKQPPPRLKHLELAPPARDWVSGIRTSNPTIGSDNPSAGTGSPDNWRSSAAVVAAIVDDDGPDGITVAPHGPDGAPAYDGPEGRAAVEYGSVSTAASEHAASDQAASDQAASDRAYSAYGASSGDADSHAEQAAATGLVRPASPDRSSESVGRHGHRGQDAEVRPIAFTQPIAPRSAVDGSWTWGRASLTQDQVRVADEAHDRFSAAEGRNLFGSYGASGLTPMLRSVEERLEHGRLAPGTEQEALLDPDTFKARLSDLLRRYPDRTAEQLALRVPGALCYCFVLETAYYSDGAWLIQEELQARGYQLQARKNAWGNSENRCVFTIWRDQASDLPFQVQFHTPASLGAQQLARTSATLISDSRIPAGEAANLRSDLANAWAALPSPPGNDQIGDYRRGTGTAPRG